MVQRMCKLPAPATPCSQLLSPTRPRPEEWIDRFGGLLAAAWACTRSHLRINMSASVRIDVRFECSGNTSAV